MSIAIFPGSFDVFHDGHMFILKKALFFYDKVIILVSNNDNKKHKTDLLTRKENIINIIKKNNIQNVVIDHNTGYTIDYCCKHKIFNLVRGIRDKHDFFYELNLCSEYKKNNANINILYIYSSLDFINIRSSLITNN